MTVEDYPHVTRVPTRWHDNDVYGHVNNVEYYAVFDTVINEFLIREGGLDIHRGPVIGLCAESRCAFHAAFAFPEVIVAGLGVSRLGRSSVRYELALYLGESPDAGGGGLVRARIRRPREPSTGGDTSGRARSARASPRESAVNPVRCCASATSRAVSSKACPPDAICPPPSSATTRTSRPRPARCSDRKRESACCRECRPPAGARRSRRRPAG